MATVQVPLPLQAPLQPTNFSPDSAVALRVTDVPVSKLAPQPDPQSMPCGEERTVPFPDNCTLSVNFVAPPASGPPPPASCEGEVLPGLCPPPQATRQAIDSHTRARMQHPIICYPIICVKVRMTAHARNTPRGPTAS